MDFTKDLHNADFIFFEDGSVNWPAMFEEHLYILENYNTVDLEESIYAFETDFPQKVEDSSYSSKKIYLENLPLFKR